MISQHMGLALDLGKVKAIYIHDMKLVFEFNDMLKTIFNTEINKYEIRTFSNSPVMQEFTTMDTLHECFNTWIEKWREYQEIHNKMKQKDI